MQYAFRAVRRVFLAVGQRVARFQVNEFVDGGGGGCLGRATFSTTRLGGTIPSPAA